MTMGQVDPRSQDRNLMWSNFGVYLYLFGMSRATAGLGFFPAMGLMPMAMGLMRMSWPGVDRFVALAGGSAGARAAGFGVLACLHICAVGRQPVAGWMIRLPGAG